jgi:YD repeat-containing protein
MVHSKFNRCFFALMLFLAGGAGGVVYAQDTTNTIGNVSIASPTAASLGKYGDFPVSYNTGLPQISIPIYTVKSGSLSLPISLSYHASGLKVQEYASWVGAGWALNAGGVITRTVIGAADDRGVQAFNSTTNGYYSDSGYNSYLFIPNSGQTIGISYDGYFPDDQNFLQGHKDGEPDLYFFNFGGYTGKFYFNDDQTPIMVPEEDFKIQPDLNNGVGGMGFQGFIVTTPDGVKYYFGMTGNDNTAVAPIEISVPSTTQNGPAASNMAVSSWYLNKIVSADGMDSINLTYFKEQFSEYTLSMSPVYSNSSGGGFNPNTIYSYGLVKNFIQGVRLSGISFPNGAISFTPSASPRTDLAGYSNQGFYDEPNTNSGNNNLPSYGLGSISITSNNGFCKKDSLYTSYFQDNVNQLNGNLATFGSYAITSDTYRLRLDSIQETSCDATAKIPPYKFSYYPELVPRKLSFGLDHWGFYNGVTTNQGLIPTYFVTQGSGYPVMAYTGANRDASWPAMRGGALQRITYPTGGYTNFTFQANDTYCSYNTYTPTPTNQGYSVGYDGGTQTTGTYTSPATSNTFAVILTDNLSSGTGIFQMTNASTGVNAVTLDDVLGGTDTAYFICSPNTTYNINLSKNSSQGAGYGLMATLTQMVPTFVQGNIAVGGLRIDTLTSSDGLTADSVVTHYTYTANGGTQSSGILYSRPVYVQPLRNNAYGWVYGPINGTPGCLEPGVPSYYISPTSITPMSEVQGNHIGYNEVDVTQAGNGKSVYRYYGSEYWDFIIGDVCTRNLTNASCSSSIPSFPFAPLPFDPMRGELQSESYFNQNGQELKEVDYTPVYVMDSLTTPACKYAEVTDYQGYTGYLLQSARKTQTTTVSTMSDPTIAQQVSTTSMVYYGSSYHHQPTRKVTSTSTGDSLATNTKYVMDFRIAGCDAIPDSIPWYINTVDADSVQLFNDLGVCAASNWMCRLDTLANFRRHVSLTRNQYVRYRRRSFSGPTNIQSSCYLAALPSADTLLKPVLRLQNMYEDVPIETSQWRDFSLLQASYTRYDSSTSPVGYAYPGRTKLINLQAPSSTFTNAVVSGNTIAKDSRYADETYYSFANGKPLQVLPRSGITTSYLWDYLNTEPIAKVTNAVQADIAYTSFESNGQGNWSFGGTIVTDPSSPTGNNCYALGSGSISKTGLTATTTYVVSYWSKTGASYSVSGSTAVVQGKTIGAWTYFEHTVTGVTTETVSGTGNIDELRLYPSTAQMTTYTYTPLVGMTAQCDVDNRVTYYQYDALGRMKVILDQDHNVIKTVQYHYQGQ